MKNLSRENYLVTPWKNGQGITSQIAISPSSATLSELNFDWRISSAKIASSNEFSQFPGFQRILTVIKGQGLKLNQYILKPFEFYQFDGNKKIHCEMIGGEVEDLGVIYNSQKVKAEMKLVTGRKLNITSGHHFLFSNGEYFEINQPELIEIKDQSILISIINL